MYTKQFCKRFEIVGGVKTLPRTASFILTLYCKIKKNLKNNIIFIKSVLENRYSICRVVRKKAKLKETIIPDILAITVARNSDIGLTYGFTRSAQVRADRLLSPEDRVLLT